MERESVDSAQQPQSAAAMVAAGTFCTICVLALWDFLASRFVPSPAGRVGALAAAAVISAATMIWVIFGPPFRKGSKSLADLAARSPLLAAAPARALFCGGFIFLFAYCAAEGAAWEFWTWAFGKSGDMTVHVAGYETAGRRSCAGLNFEDAPVFLRRGVCVDYARDEEAPPPGSTVRLQGRSSGLGIDVESFSVLERATPSEP